MSRPPSATDLSLTRITDVHIHIQPWRELKPPVLEVMWRGKEGELSLARRDGIHRCDQRLRREVRAGRPRADEARRGGDARAGPRQGATTSTSFIRSRSEIGRAHV